MALYTCDPSSGNTLGFQPSKLLTPKDAFAVRWLRRSAARRGRSHLARRRTRAQMFDDDNSGSLDFNEFLMLVVRRRRVPALAPQA